MRNKGAREKDFFFWKAGDFRDGFCKLTDPLAGRKNMQVAALDVAKAAFSFFVRLVLDFVVPSSFDHKG